MVKARALIEQGWCQATYWRAADGNTVLDYSEGAVRHCIRGALIAADEAPLDADLNYLPSISYLEAEKILIGKLPTTAQRSLTNWNDNKFRSQSDVLELLDSCIKDLPE